MLLEYGAQCPAFGAYKVGNDKYGLNCRYCRGKLKVCSNGIDCGFSKKPNCIPKYKIGQSVICNGLRKVIRKIEWDGRFVWTYIFARERTPYNEDTIFLTRKEYEEYKIKQSAKILLSQMTNYCETYNIPLDILKTKMLELK